MKARLTEDERRLFRESVGEVRRLSHDRVHALPSRPPPQPVQRREDELAVIRDLLSLDFDPADLETGEELLYARPGLPRTVMRRLRRGQFAVAAQLDLHGMTVAVAHQALNDFLRRARQDGARCVRIVHGKGRGSPKGRPVLKQKVSHWLRQRDDVLAFSSARGFDGGTGAVYVLLRR